MASDDVADLLEEAAPTPRTALDPGRIEQRAHRRRRRRRLTVTAASLCAVGALTALAVRIPHSRDRATVAAGPASSRRIPMTLHGSTATAEVRLLDGSRLRLTLPRAVGGALAGTTFADVELHGSLSSGSPGQPPRGWRIDVSVGSVQRLVPGGQPLVPPPSSPASAATVDRQGRRLGVQFGSWALVASGESLSDADVDVLLTGVSLVERPDGFVEYRGALPLWPVDGADARLGGDRASVSVFIGDFCPDTVPTRRTPSGLDSYRIEDAPASGRRVELCDRRQRLRIGLETNEPRPDDEIDHVRVEVLTVGPTLAAVRQGRHP